MASKVPQTSEDYELLTTGQEAAPTLQARRGLPSFLWHHPTILAALALGTCGTLACFAFTFWLSKQIFHCPDWALYCSVQSSVRYFATHLNQVQGIVSAVYGIFMSMVAYAAYQLAETTLWPALTTRTFTLRNIDHYLAVSRGAYTSSLGALWHARGGYHISVLLTVTFSALLLEANSVIVGHAFSLTRVPSTFYSNHTAGGGTGFGFSQSNPPGDLPGAIGDAYPVYNAWANDLSSEPMPDQRDYIVDRSNFSAIGNFSVNVVEAQKHINCSAMPIKITQDVEAVTDSVTSAYFQVATSRESDILDEDSDDSDSSVQLRLQPELTLWVDQWTQLDNNSAVTRLFFAAINGSIEGGHDNEATELMKDDDYYGISSLACDVRVTLSNSILCLPEQPCGDNNPPNATLSSLATMDGDDAARNAVWLAAVLTTFGVSAYGTQPMFSPGLFLDNNSLALPVAYTTWVGSGTSYNWSQANLTNFIEVGSGALGMVYTRSWFNGSQTVISTQYIQGLDTHRSYYLLVPLALMLGSVMLQAIASALMYRSSDVAVTRLGSTSEMIISSETNDVKAAVDEARKAANPSEELMRLKVRYGMVADGYDGLARKGRLTAFPKRRVYGSAGNKVI